MLVSSKAPRHADIRTQIQELKLYAENSLELQLLVRLEKLLNQYSLAEILYTFESSITEEIRYKNEMYNWLMENFNLK